MGMLDEIVESWRKNPVRPPMDEETMDPLMPEPFAAPPSPQPPRSGLTDILSQLSTSAESPEEREARAKKKMVLGLAEAFEQAATAGSRSRTGEGFDGGYYARAKQGIDQERQTDLSQKQELLKNRILGKQLVDAETDRTRQQSRQDEARSFQIEDRGREASDRAEGKDPTAKKAVTLAGMIKSLDPAAKVEGLGFIDLEPLVPLAKAVRDARTESQKIAAQNALTKATNDLKYAADKAKNDTDSRDKSFEQEKKIRHEYRDNPIVVAAEEGDRGLTQLESNLAQKTKAGDLAAIFNFMKTLDPRSVVRDGEQLSVQRTDGIFGVMQRYTSMFNKEGSLTPQARAELLEAMRAQVAVAKQDLPTIQERYFNPIISQYNLSPDNIYGRTQGAAANAGPKDDPDTVSAFDNIKLQAGRQELGSGAADVTPDKIKKFAQDNRISETQARMIIERRIQK